MVWPYYEVSFLVSQINLISFWPSFFCSLPNERDAIGSCSVWGANASFLLLCVCYSLWGHRGHQQHVSFGPPIWLRPFNHSCHPQARPFTPETHKAKANRARSTSLTPPHSPRPKIASEPTKHDLWPEEKRVTMAMVYPSTCISQYEAKPLLASYFYKANCPVIQTCCVNEHPQMHLSDRSGWSPFDSGESLRVVNNGRERQEREHRRESD